MIDSYHILRLLILFIVILPRRILTQTTESTTSSEVEGSIIGLRIETPHEMEFRGGVAHVLANSVLHLRLFGVHLKPGTHIRFTNQRGEIGEICNHNQQQIATRAFELNVESNFSATAQVDLPPRLTESDVFYICLRENDTRFNMPWVHQGTRVGVSLTTYTRLLPIWTKILFIVLLLTLSGLFSGLNLGLMALGKTELKILASTGSDRERKYAKSIQPLRNNGNFLLCTLLLGNVLVNSTLTILVDDLTSGLVAIICSTIGIVILGEIIPQAVCSRHGLAVGANTVYVTKFMMALTFVASYPVSVVLDKALGEEIGNVYNRERLKELLRLTKDYHGLALEEVGFISGALDLKKKTVKDIMTKIDSVFMLPYEAILDYETMAEIEHHGYSRIPIYEEDRGNVVALLNVKQLTLLNASENVPLKTVVDFYQSQLFYVFENTRLDYMFKAFKEGNRGHMAIIQQLSDEGPGDSYYETIGIVTMEDVLEELLQAEILDETDVGKLKPRNEMENPGGYLGYASPRGQIGHIPQSIKNNSLLGSQLEINKSN